MFTNNPPRAKLCLLATLAGLLTSSLNALTIDDVWINEIHYDNDSTDVGEFVEIAGIAGTDLGLLSLEFYNGNGGARYKNVGLSGTLADSGDGYGFSSVLISGIQNGSPDGLALVFETEVLQFISYEGSFTATSHTANGLNSTNIGVEEPNDSVTGLSLQFLGYADVGSWTGPIAATAGSMNTGQVLPALESESDPSSTSVPDNGTTFGLLGLGFAMLITIKRRHT